MTRSKMGHCLRTVAFWAGLMGLPLAGCNNTGGTGLFALSSSSSPSASQPVENPINIEEGRAYAARWKAAYDAHPDDKRAALNYALGLRAATQYGQAIAVLQGLV